MSRCQLLPASVGCALLGILVLSGSDLGFGPGFGGTSTSTGLRMSMWATTSRRTTSTSTSTSPPLRIPLVPGASGKSGNFLTARLAQGDAARCALAYEHNSNLATLHYAADADGHYEACLRRTGNIPGPGTQFGLCVPVSVVGGRKVRAELPSLPELELTPEWTETEHEHSYGEFEIQLTEVSRNLRNSTSPATSMSAQKTRELMPIRCMRIPLFVPTTLYQKICARRSSCMALNRVAIAACAPSFTIGSTVTTGFSVEVFLSFSMVKTCQTRHSNLQRYELDSWQV